MRRIQTQEIKEKKQRRLQIIMAVALIGLMVSSTIGFLLVSQGGGFGRDEEIGERITYNGIEFSQGSGFWQSTINNNLIITSHNPEETEGLIDIEVSTNDFSGKTLYYTTDDKSARAIQEIIQNLGSFASRYQEACIENRECRNEDLVMKNCSDNVISFTLSNQIKAYKEENCIFLEASNDEANLVSDALIFRALGIQ